MPENVIAENEARVNVTFGGQNGDLPDPVNYTASDTEIKGWVAEAVRTGSIPSIPAAPAADFSDFVVDRFEATEARPYRAIFVRPKTPFGR
jgi:hypothetical protein